MRHTFETQGRYIDSFFEIFTRDGLLHIVQQNVEKESGRTYEVGRVALNPDEYFEIYHKLVQTSKFEPSVRYAEFLMNRPGSITIQTARELWRIATHQVENFLVLKSKTHTYAVLAVEDPIDHLRLEENFADRLIASCHRNKLRIITDDKTT